MLTFTHRNKQHRKLTSNQHPTVLQVFISQSCYTHILDCTFNLTTNKISLKSTSSFSWNKEITKQSLLLQDSCAHYLHTLVLPFKLIPLLCMISFGRIEQIIKRTPLLIPAIINYMFHISWLSLCSNESIYIYEFHEKCHSVKQ